MAERKARKKKSEFERRVKEFGEELESLGKRVERRGEKCDSWYCRTFGIAGPLISSVFGLAILFLAIWAITFVNLPFGNAFLSSVGTFLLGNAGWFFLIILLFSYASFFSRHYPDLYTPFSPLAVAAGIAIGMWLLSNAIRIANASIGDPALSTIWPAIGRLIPAVFGAAVFIGYVILVVKISVQHPEKKAKAAAKQEKPARSAKPGDVRRLYRSGKDKILGGVCGGLGEYFGVDPVLIRLIFVILAFAWGLGILLYIIFWIIIPRNPGHKWSR